MSSERDLFFSRPLLQQQDFARSVRRAWRILWRGKFLILACMVLVLVPTVLLVKQIPKSYTAETTIMIQSPETNDILTERNGNAMPYRLGEDVIQTEVELISSSMLARRAVEKLNLENDPEFNAALRPPSAFQKLLSSLSPARWLSGGGAGEEAAAAASAGNSLSPLAREEVSRARIVRAFQQRLQVRPKKRTYIVTIQFSSLDREKAMLIANTMAELYVLDRLEASFTEARQVSGWLGERLSSLQKDAMAAESAVEQFRSSHDLRRTSGGGQVTINDQQLSELNSRLVIARADLAQKQARLQQARALGSRGNVDTSSDVLQSSLIQRLREQETQKSRELSEAMKTYGERHPHIVGLKADLNDLRGKISEEVRKIAQSMDNDVNIALAGVRTLENELNQLQKRNNMDGETAVRLRDLERQAEASRGLYETFLTRFKREGEQANMRRANARVVSVATIPTQPSAPAVAKTVIMASMASLFIGLVLVFILDKLDHTVRSADDAEDLVGLPVLALIPRRRHGRKQGGDQEALEEVRLDNRSALSDAVRSLRTALLVGENEAPFRTVLVTSSVPREGKTFVSMYLAATFARLDKKVLLIDSDVFRPRLHSALGVEGDKGLVQVLKGELASAEAIQTNVLGSLDFLPAGRGARVSDLLQSEQLETLLASLARDYSRIIIDSPPVLAVADVRTVARLADKVVYLMKWGNTPRDGIRNGIKLLRAAGAPLAGVVLSQVDQRKHAGYGYGDYGQYYGRYAEYYGKE